MLDKAADVAGPGIGDYTELEKVLPRDYSSALTPKETQKAILAAKQYIEENLCKELNLIMVTVPLIVDVERGVNDLLDRDGSRTPIQFHISKRSEQTSRRRSGGTGGDEMEEDGPEAVRHEARRRAVHRHAGGT
ncbi:MAG: hypothetical protein V1790_06275 [Planctomycetota bacterium]